MVYIVFYNLFHALENVDVKAKKSSKLKKNNFKNKA